MKIKDQCCDHTETSSKTSEHESLVVFENLAEHGMDGPGILNSQLASHPAPDCAPSSTLVKS
jgi:hypothetical protein